MALGAREGTLQKSIDLTPLLPRAGPTGGLGEACPAPTMSLTTWSLAIAFRAIGTVVGVWSTTIRRFGDRADPKDDQERKDLY